MKILITGGGGYIGSYIINNLPKKYDIICLDHGKKYSQFDESVKNNVTLIKGDVTDSKLLEKIMSKGIDTIIHCAGTVGNSVCMEDPMSAISSHIHGTQLLIEKSIKFKVKRFIYMSTLAVYSTFTKRKIPFTENTELKPDDFYGTLKMIAEKHIQKNQPNYVILRLANVYGKARKAQNKTKLGVVENFIDAILEKTNITIYGTGKQKMELVHIKDVYNCVLTILQNSNIKGEIFNVGSGKLVSIEELATAISKSSKKFYRYEPEIKKISNRNDKVWPDRFMSICRIKKKIGWKPKISLTNGIELMLENGKKVR